MNKRILSIALVSMAMLMAQVSCKKDKEKVEPSGPTKVATLALEHRSTNAVYGREYTFRLQFESLGGVKEYGIVFVPWIGEKTDRTPLYNGTTSVLFPFTDKPGPAGTIQLQTHTFAYTDFNDANYRAYAILNDGTIVYGEVLHIVFT